MHAIPPTVCGRVRRARPQVLTASAATRRDHAGSAGIRLLHWFVFRRGADGAYKGEHLMHRFGWTAPVFGALVCVSTALADTIIQEGSLSGTGEPMTQDVVLDQFDPMGGTRELNFVQLDFLTSIIGGYQTDGSGVQVRIFSRLDADYSLDDTLLADTTALIESVVPNTSPGAFSVFNTDTAGVLIDQPEELAPWIGTGDITLSAFTEFVVRENPPNVIFFDAGGIVEYTVTYDYTVVPEPATLALLGLGSVLLRRRRHRPSPKGRAE